MMVDTKLPAAFDNIILEYRQKRPLIRKRLKEFDKFATSTNRAIFTELAFCLFTPGTKAINGDRAVRALRESNLLFEGSQRAIANLLRGIVRFHNNKASYLVAAQKLFKSGKSIDIKRILDRTDILNTREWLVSNVKGIGYKEASHFLRNIGLGKGLSILDVHILKNLERCKVIDEIPASISRRTYIKIEDKMRRFASSINIPIEELDLLFWSSQTGFIFK